MSQENSMQVEKYLRGVNFPIARAELIKRAQQNGADARTISTLEQLPDQKFDSVAAVNKAVSAIEVRH